MIQIAYFNTPPLTIGTELKAEFTLIEDEQEASFCRGPLILGLDQKNLENIKKIIDIRDHQVVIAFSHKNDFKLIPVLKEFLPKIFGFIDLTTEPEIAIPLLRNYINLNFSKESLQLEKLSKELEAIEERTLTELRGIKELHDRFVKIRTEKIKGAELLIKFMAGEKSGGEFFDYISRDSQMLFVQAGSDSYIMSSLIISAMEDFKVKNENLYESIDSFIAGLNYLANENGAKLSYSMMIVNLKNMEANIYNKGDSRIFYHKEIIAPVKNSILKLKRGERITFLSEGTFLNWNKYYEGKKVQDFLLKHLDKNNRDFINELFFELARSKKGTFLDNDALVAMLEIDEHVLHQL